MKSKASIAYSAVSAARDVVEGLYSVGTWEFDDARIKDIAYTLNSICITLSKIRDEEEGKDEENA